MLSERLFSSDAMCRRYRHDVLGIMHELLIYGDDLLGLRRDLRSTLLGVATLLSVARGRAVLLTLIDAESEESGYLRLWHLR